MSSITRHPVYREPVGSRTPGRAQVRIPQPRVSPEALGSDRVSTGRPSHQFANALVLGLLMAALLVHLVINR
jgi:hypothetical protein